jgi:hypothetical protein
MKASKKALNAYSGEASLRWTLCVMGILLALSSTFFLIRKITLSPATDYFFLFGLILGIVTVVSGLVPARPVLRPQEPQPAYAHRRSSPRR